MSDDDERQRAYEESMQYRAEKILKPPPVEITEDTESE